MWILAACAMGAAYGWPAVFVLAKPSLAPYALFGVRSRAWWVAFALFMALCAPFGFMWVDWVRATMLNPTNGGILYSLPYVPVMSVPVVAWIGRRPQTPRPLAARPKRCVTLPITEQ